MATMSIPNNLTKTVIHNLSEREMRSLLQEIVPTYKLVLDGLQKAEEHLEYCGYGDNWERECAREQGLASTIEHALTKAKELKV